METQSQAMPEDRSTVRENAIQMLKGTRVAPYEFRAIIKNGEVRWALESVAPIQYHGKQATIGSYQDITERKKTEDMLRKSQQKYKTLVENIPQKIFQRIEI